jgi:hypothetical protein
MYGGKEQQPTRHIRENGNWTEEDLEGLIY